LYSDQADLLSVQQRIGIVVVMDVAELEILCEVTIVVLIVLGSVRRWIIASVVTVIHSISPQRFEKFDNSTFLATVLTRKAFNATTTDLVAVVFDGQAWQANM
jgi:hypothetical protein